jgi:heme-degrading monooxygenase HmoA
MFARCVTVRIKAGMSAEASHILESEVLPLLRGRRGFQDAIFLAAPDGTETVGISLWDSQESADAYQNETFAAVERITAKVTEGTPQVKTYEVSHTTLRRTAARGNA